MGIGLDTIKRVNIGKVFAILACGGMYSRAELAERTGLSLMTVGKTVELLEKYGALVQKKSKSDRAGRKSSVCGLDCNRLAFVYDLSAEPYNLYSIDILLRTREKYSFNFDNLNEISARAFIESGEMPLGYGCIHPDFDSALQRRFIASLGREPEVIETCVRAAAIANATRFNAITSAHLILSDKNNSYGAIVQNGKPYIGDFGRAGNFCDLIKLLGDPVKAVAAICVLFDPGAVRIECPNRASCETLRESLERNLPNLANAPVSAQIITETAEDGLSPVIGGAIMLRERWLDTII